MKEIGVHSEEVIARAAVQSARSQYPPSLKPVSHPFPLRITMQRCKSLHLRLNSFQSFVIVGHQPQLSLLSPF